MDFLIKDFFRIYDQIRSFLGSAEYEKLMVTASLKFISIIRMFLKKTFFATNCKRISKKYRNSYSKHVKF